MISNECEFYDAKRMVCTKVNGNKTDKLEKCPFNYKLRSLCERRRKINPKKQEIKDEAETETNSKKSEN